MKIVIFLWSGYYLGNILITMLTKGKWVNIPILVKWMIMVTCIYKIYDGNQRFGKSLLFFLMYLEMGFPFLENLKLWSLS